MGVDVSGYCFKCKSKQQIVDACEVEMDVEKHPRMRNKILLKGKCPVCASQVCSFVSASSRQALVSSSMHLDKAPVDDAVAAAEAEKGAEQAQQ
jgi:hypothetical protein